MPVAAQHKQNSLNMVKQAMKPTMNVNTAMNRNIQYQSQQVQIAQKLITETDELLLSYNVQLFQPLGLQATSSYSSYPMIQQQGYTAYDKIAASQIGIIIKKYHQEIVYVMQKQEGETQVGDTLGNKAPPKYAAQ